MSPQGEISGVPVSHWDDSGVYSAVQMITELRQTVGCVYQYQRRSPRLHINASLTLHLYMTRFGDWSQLISPPSSLLLILFLSTLPNLLPSPAFSLLSFLPNSSSFCCMPRCTNHSVCVHVSSLSLQADLLRRGGDKGAGNGGQNSSLVANEFLIRATNGAVPPMWLERSQSTGDRRPVTYTARVS